MLEEERDRYFHMKRLNAGLYAHVRDRLQKARAILLPMQNIGSVDLALKVMDAPKPSPEWVSMLMERYAGDLVDAEEPWVAMCGEVETLLTSGAEDEAYRFLGLIQGVLYSRGCYSLAELQEHLEAA